MDHRRNSARLWLIGISLYALEMTRKAQTKLLNFDPKAFWAFLDGYATGMDIDPVCRRPRFHSSPEALWADFERVATDASSAFHRKVKKPG